MSSKILIRIAAFIAAIIFLQTLYFKFTGAEESVVLFTKLGVEPWGRFATGVIELIAAILLIIPRTSGYGGLLGVGLMAGAILSHLFIIGIESAGDGGFLFILAVVAFICSLVVLIANKQQVLRHLGK